MRLILVLFTFLVYSCNLAGEYHSICNIDYQSNSLRSTEIIDSLVLLHPKLKERVQGTTFSYDISGTGFESENLFLWYDGIHYVLSISFYSDGDMQRLKIINFGEDGKVLNKYDGLSRENKKLAKRIIQEELLFKLQDSFSDIVFYCNC